MAAHYYQVAVEKHQSARANFNLGFMYQWGLGVKQDFPLAKRHYDLAVSGHSRESELAVQVALMAMNFHESVIRWKVVLENWWFERHDRYRGTTENDMTIKSPKAFDHDKVGEPLPMPRSSVKKTREEVIMSHVFNWSSFLIVALLAIVLKLIVMVKKRRQR